MDETSSRSTVFRTDKLIRFQHCDPAEIFFYPQWLVLFHEVIENWFGEGLGIDYGHFISTLRLGTPTVRLEFNFIAPAVIGETPTFRLRMRTLGNSSIALSLDASDAGGQARVQIEQTVVLFSLDDRHRGFVKLTGLGHVGGIRVGILIR